MVHLTREFCADKSYPGFLRREVCSVRAPSSRPGGFGLVFVLCAQKRHRSADRAGVARRGMVQHGYSVPRQPAKELTSDSGDIRLSLWYKLTDAAPRHPGGWTQATCEGFTMQNWPEEPYTPLHDKHPDQPRSTPRHRTPARASRTRGPSFRSSREVLKDCAPRHHP